MTNHLVDKTVAGSRVLEVYNAVIARLQEIKATRSETIAGLLAVIAVQVRKDTVPTDELTTFLRDASEWIQLYLMPTEKEQVN